MDLIDLDAALAEHAKAAGQKSRGFVYKKTKFELPPFLPLLVNDVIAAAKDEKWPDAKFVEEYTKALLGEEQWARFKQLGADQIALMTLFDESMERYGTSMGESGPSASSSRRAGGSSRRRSGATTKKTPPRTSPAK